MPYPATTPASMVTYFQDAGLKPVADAQIEELFQACKLVIGMAERARPHGAHEVEPSSTFSASSAATAAVFKMNAATGTSA